MVADENLTSPEATCRDKGFVIDTFVPEIGGPVIKTVVSELLE
jgi:hypothetical protein